MVMMMMMIGASGAEPLQYVNVAAYRRHSMVM